MVNNEMITLVGFVCCQAGHFNFYPARKKIGEALVYLDQDDRKLIESDYSNINFECPDELNAYEEIDRKIKDFIQIVGASGRKVCSVSFNKKDLTEYEGIDKFTGKKTKKGKKLALSVLYKYNENEDMLSDSLFYSVVKSNQINWGTSIDEIRSNREVAITTRYGGLIAGNQYFLQFKKDPWEYKENGEYRYVGPLKCDENGEMKKPENYDKLLEFDDDLNQISNGGDMFFYYTGEPFGGVIDNGDNNTDNTEKTGRDDGSENNQKFKNEIKQRQELCDKIKKYRPDYTTNDVYNILICITQNLLTVFSGSPGTGKTSMCRLLSDILGLSANERFLSIPVQRGWTSKNDLIGYYNPLNNQFISNTGLSDVLIELNNEVEENHMVYPYFVLLDEANLSQMEYYWSDFIMLADDINRRDSQLRLAPENAKSDFVDAELNDENQAGIRKTQVWVPDTLKFIATINNDQTTEALSPRLLDRTWIIELPLPVIESTSIVEDIKKAQNCYSWEELSKMFGENCDFDSDMYSEALAKLTSIYEIYRKNRKIVSPRTQGAIKKYLKAAISCFEGEGKLDEIIDFIIVQKLLPMINGYISNDFKEKLEKEICLYKKSAEKFKEMCSENDFDSIFANFFI